MLRLKVPIRFSDVDWFGHVNHARFLSFCEDHRGEMFRPMQEATGEDWQDAGYVVVRVEADYKAPIAARTPDALVEGEVERIGRTSLTLRYRVLDDQRVYAKIICTLVRSVDGVTTPISDSARAWLEGYASLAPEIWIRPQRP